MATYNPQMAVRNPFPQSVAAMAPAYNAPPGTFAPGTKVQVGNHRVVIDRYLSEGGFAHVYVVTLPKPVDGEEKAVLKRVAVPDKEHLANMRIEVETMKRLRGHKYIVKYIDSHASSLKNGGYEVFLLMEYCQGGGLIDFMNTRLQNRLTEPEILNIFTDIAEGVACMHYLKPPLLHRDLKIENVLISTSGKSRIYKLCDFGSAAPPRPAASSVAEGRLIEDDIQQHTTLQYRSPEMIDVYRKQPIDEKSDIWALGCFLYKLCYYTTPFEEGGQMAILNASFKYPGYPKFSDQLKLLIATMLREDPSQRPNIYQVLHKASQMDGREFKLKDIYSDRTQSEKRRTEVLPDPSSAQSRSGATLAAPKQEPAPSIPDIAPMRRGRPSAPSSHHNSAKPSPSPLRMIERSDPFTNLDGNKTAGGDELSSKFPTLDQFSLMTDKSSRFAFQSEPNKSQDPKEEDLSKRVTNALADEAFARPPSPVKTKPPIVVKGDVVRAATVSTRPRPTETGNVPPKGTAAAPAVPKKPVMVSVGTMTSPTLNIPSSLPPISDRPIWKIPNTERSSSTGPASRISKPARPAITSSGSGSRLANLLKQDASRSLQSDGNSPTADPSRLSMEGDRPSFLELGKDATLSRSRSLNIRTRPVSVNMGAGPTHINDQELKKSKFEPGIANSSLREAESAITDSDNNIASDIDFLKAKEEEEKEKTRHVRRGSSKSRHSKRASLPSIALAGTKNILQGRFGEAFKKFESSDDPESESARRDDDGMLSPIIGSETTDLSDAREPLDETEDLSPEMRRELEKRYLEAEERRVANAAAEYRQRATAGGGRPPVPSGKAASIQNRVQSLLQDSGRPVAKTATGYGQYTNQSQSVSPAQGVDRPVQQPQVVRSPPVYAIEQEPRSISAPASQVSLPKMQRPVAPPKPRVLQNHRAETMPATVGSEESMSGSHIPGIGDEWEEQFSKKYPSLSHLEMVETEIENRPLATTMTVKEV